MFSFTTEVHPDWDKKIEEGLLKECRALTGHSTDFEPYTLYTKKGETFAGAIRLECHGPILWIDSIWVELDFRRQGIGRQLLQEAHLFATQNNAKEIQPKFPDALQLGL